MLPTCIIMLRMLCMLCQTLHPPPPAPGRALSKLPRYPCYPCSCMLTTARHPPSPRPTPRCEAALCEAPCYRAAPATHDSILPMLCMLCMLSKAQHPPSPAPHCAAPPAAPPSRAPAQTIHATHATHAAHAPMPCLLRNAPPTHHLPLHVAPRLLQRRVVLDLPRRRPAAHRLA
jgi:hypothetical protein